MPWGRMDDTFHDHPKVEELSLEAIGLWTKCWSVALRQVKTSPRIGFISDAKVHEYARRKYPQLVAELTTPLPGKEHAMWDKVDGGFLFHNFPKYLPKRRDPNEAAASGRKGAERRWGSEHGKPDSNSHSSSHSSSHDDEIANSHNGAIAKNGTRAYERAFPTRPVNDEVLKGEERNETSDAENATATPPPNELDEQLNPLDARCSRHRGVADPPPCAGCRNARERAEAKAARTADKARREREAVIKRCPDCHGTGWRENPDTALPAGRCDHPSLANAS